jgi:hypothetical protein
MIKTLGIVILNVASYSSILGLYFTVYPYDQHHPLWRVALILMLTAACLILSTWEVADYLKQSAKRFRSTARINNYMRHWLESGGRAVIFTRDMSWAHEQQIQNILFLKARRQELTICIEQPISLTNELQLAGARIISYASLGHTPRSRFTIIDFEKEGARVAIGGKVGSVHNIQEFQNGVNAEFGVAEDLAKILIAFGERG